MISNKSMTVGMPYFRLLKITMAKRNDTDALQYRYLRGSGIEDALIETEVFGKLTLISVL